MTYEEFVVEFAEAFKCDPDSGIEQYVIQDTLFELFERSYKQNMFYIKNKLFLDILPHFPSSFKRQVASWTHELEHWVNMFDAWWFAWDNWSIIMSDRTE